MWGVGIDFLRVRALENDMAIVVANRYGKEGQGTKPISFIQETFAILSPFAHDFSYGSHSAIVTHDGQVLADISDAHDEIGYGELTVPDERIFPVIRRPSLYPLLAQDTLEPYTEKQLRQPKATQFTAAALNPSGPKGRTVEGVMSAITAAIQARPPSAVSLRLVVLPQGLFDLLCL